MLVGYIISLALIPLYYSVENNARGTTIQGYSDPTKDSENLVNIMMQQTC